jgi:hypothetical protein
MTSHAESFTHTFVTRQNVALVVESPKPIDMDAIGRMRDPRRSWTAVTLNSVPRLTVRRLDTIKFKVTDHMATRRSSERAHHATAVPNRIIALQKGDLGKGSRAVLLPADRHGQSHTRRLRVVGGQARPPRARQYRHRAGRGHTVHASEHHEGDHLGRSCGLEANAPSQSKCDPLLTPGPTSRDRIVVGDVPQLLHPKQRASMRQKHAVDEAARIAADRLLAERLAEQESTEWSKPKVPAVAKKVKPVKEVTPAGNRAELQLAEALKAANKRADDAAQKARDAVKKAEESQQASAQQIQQLRTELQKQREQDTQRAKASKKPERQVAPPPFRYSCSNSAPVVEAARVAAKITAIIDARDHRAANARHDLRPVPRRLFPNLCTGPRPDVRATESPRCRP